MGLSPFIYVMGKKEKSRLKYENNIFNSNDCGKFKVVKYNSCNSVDIEFLQTKTKMNIKSCCIKRGSVYDRIHPNVYDKGFVGIGNFKVSVNNKHTKEYSTWKNMMMRCYSKKNYITYKNCTVCKDWHNFQNFAKWYSYNYTSCLCKDLDKDLLSKDKQYSPDTCCLIPHEVNTAIAFKHNKNGELPIGVGSKRDRFIVYFKLPNNIKNSFSTSMEAYSVYKKEKTNHIKYLANKYKNIITPTVYDALINYSI